MQLVELQIQEFWRVENLGILDLITYLYQLNAALALTSSQIFCGTK